MQKVTSSQQKILTFYNEFIKENGRTPTYKEASQSLGINSSAIYVHVKNLEKKGLIDKFGKYISVTADSFNIPLLGSIACGKPISVFESCDEYVEVPKSSFREGQFYALRAVGDSMKNAWIKSGDTLVIRQQNDVNDGDIGVVVVGEYADDERATLKRVYHTPKSLILKPENDDFPTQIITEPSQVRGKLVSVIRNY